MMRKMRQVSSLRKSAAGSSKVLSFNGFWIISRPFREGNDGGREEPEREAVRYEAGGQEAAPVFQ
jgi:hypothetical protein